jgi:membrane-anchored glycerophosphoryl diester phosphodiesterase (GDPDase)
VITSDYHDHDGPQSVFYGFQELFREVNGRVLSWKTLPFTFYFFLLLPGGALSFLFYLQTSMALKNY